MAHIHTTLFMTHTHAHTHSPNLRIYIWYTNTLSHLQTNPPPTNIWCTVHTHGRICERKKYVSHYCNKNGQFISWDAMNISLFIIYMMGIRVLVSLLLSVFLYTFFPISLPTDLWISVSIFLFGTRPPLHMCSEHSCVRVFS